MKFLKEYIIIIIILIIIFTADFFTNKSLGNAVNWMNEGIISIENKMKEDKEEEAQAEFYELKDRWNSQSNVLSFFAEHNELEKISSEVVEIEANFETDEKDKVIENVAELKFLLEHVNEKSQLKLKNIF